MADERVVEYCFSTEPSWACDAIECTAAGVEFNFEKLCLLCNAGELPEKICIYLEASGAPGEHGGQTSMNSSKATSGIASDGGAAPGKKPSVGASLLTPAGESFLEKEIRIAKDREEMLKQEKLERDNAGKLRMTIASIQQESQVKAVAPTGRPAQAGINAGIRAKPSPANPSPPSSMAPNNRAPTSIPLPSSTQPFKSNEFTRSLTYKHEDPVQQDVRIALLREEEMKQERASAHPRPSIGGGAVTKQPADSGKAENGTSTLYGGAVGRQERDIVIHENIAAARPKEPGEKGQIFGLTLSSASGSASPAISKVEAEIKEQLEREAQHKKSIGGQ